MDRYAENEEVKRVWDIADTHLRDRYGFSIIDIISRNPESLTVHFGGPRGKRIRDNYRSIRTSDGPSGRPAQLMREIQGNTKSFTFRSPQGLLAPVYSPDSKRGGKQGFREGGGEGNGGGRKFSTNL